jgi:hypothetical protein
MTTFYPMTIHSVIPDTSAGDAIRNRATFKDTGCPIRYAMTAVAAYAGTANLACRVVD